VVSYEGGREREDSVVTERRIRNINMRIFVLAKQQSEQRGPLRHVCGRKKGHGAEINKREPPSQLDQGINFRERCQYEADDYELMSIMYASGNGLAEYCVGLCTKVAINK
jgi:hypothetical protein